MRKIAQRDRDDLEAKLRHLIEVQKMPQRGAAKILGVSLGWVSRSCKRLGLVTQKSGPRRGRFHPNWNGGVIYRGGYCFLYAPNHHLSGSGSYAAEHRMVMEEVIGRELSRSEIVRHKDGNKQNNEPSNLEVFQSKTDRKQRI